MPVEVGRLSRRTGDSEITHLTLDHHSVVAGLWLMNDEAYHALPADLREVVRGGFGALKEASVRRSTRKQDAGVAAFEAVGGRVSIPTSAEKRALVIAAGGRDNRVCRGARSRVAGRARGGDRRGRARDRTGAGHPVTDELPTLRWPSRRGVMHITTVGVGNEEAGVEHDHSSVSRAVDDHVDLLAQPFASVRIRRPGEVEQATGLRGLVGPHPRRHTDTRVSLQRRCRGRCSAGCC